MYTKHAEFKAGLILLVGHGRVPGLPLLRERRQVALGRVPPPARCASSRASLAPTVGDPVVMNGVEIGRVETVSQATEERARREAHRSPTARRSKLDGRRGRGRPRGLRARRGRAWSPGQIVPRGTTAEISESLVGQPQAAAEARALAPRTSSDEDTLAEPDPHGGGRRLHRPPALGPGPRRQGRARSWTRARRVARRGQKAARRRARPDRGPPREGRRRSTWRASRATCSRPARRCARRSRTRPMQVDEIAGKVRRRPRATCETLTGRGVEVVDATGKDVHELLDEPEEPVGAHSTGSCSRRAAEDRRDPRQRPRGERAPSTRLGKDLEALGPRARTGSSATWAATSTRC